MTPRQDWKKDRKKWTRDQQKIRVLEWFRLRYLHDKFEPATAQEVASGLHVISGQYMKEIMEEMREVGILEERKVLHRTRRDGTQIWKSVYRPSQSIMNVDEQRVRNSDRDSVFQSRLWGE